MASRLAKCCICNAAFCSSSEAVRSIRGDALLCAVPLAARRCAACAATSPRGDLSRTLAPPGEPPGPLPSSDAITKRSVLDPLVGGEFVVGESALLRAGAGCLLPDVASTTIMSLEFGIWRWSADWLPPSPPRPPSTCPCSAGSGGFTAVNPGTALSARSMSASVMTPAGRVTVVVMVSLCGLLIRLATNLYAEAYG